MTKEDLELFRKYCGSRSIISNTHINQSFEPVYHKLNKNIQINLIKIKEQCRKETQS